MTDTSELLVRAGRRDITPARPVTLAGYAARDGKTSRVLDPVEVNAIVLQCGPVRSLLLTFDLMAVGKELQDVLLAALARLGFAPDQVLLLASHTHFGPATDTACAGLGIPDPEVVADIAQATLSLVEQVLGQTARPAAVAVTSGDLNHSVNRRLHWPFPTFDRVYGLRFGCHATAPNPGGPKNERATIIRFHDASTDEVLGILWHYTCHPTAVAPVDVVSADFPGAVRAALREAAGTPELPCAFIQGFCGDIRPLMPRASREPLPRRLRSAMTLARSGPSFPSPGPQDWVRWSASLAEAVVVIASGSPRRAALATMMMGRSEIPLAAFFDGRAPDKPLTAQVLRLGGILEFVVLSAEVCIGWAAILDHHFPPEDGVTRIHAGYSGTMFGYLPTAAQIPEGGYEVQGFQGPFGLSGQFDADRINAAVLGCVADAMSSAKYSASKAPSE